MLNPIYVKFIETYRPYCVIIYKKRTIQYLIYCNDKNLDATLGNTVESFVDHLRVVDNYKQSNLFTN